jgi:tRNA(Ile)-lysidine synthase
LGTKMPDLNVSAFRPGMRVAVACSGGADSVALLRALLEERSRLGLVLSVAHMNHGIRGAESDADASFVADLAARFNLALHLKRVDTPQTADGKREGLEETARKLRYGWFWEILSGNEADAVVTAHTLDDQSETVLHRLLRGAWTEGLGGIYPVLSGADSRGKASRGMENPGMENRAGTILRPFLRTTRREIEAWLREIGQAWREDSTNADTAYTRNRIRRELLPALATYNPKIQKQLAQLAALARDEELYWQGELGRLLPSLLLPGKAVRGGGRATDTLRGNESLSIEIERLRNLPPAVRRRVLRAAGAELGFSVNFEDTERLLAICGLGDLAGAAAPDRAGRKLELEKGLRAERTPRELRLLRAGESGGTANEEANEEYVFPIPGTIEARAFGLRVEVGVGAAIETTWRAARLRAPRPGDRVTLRYRRSPMKLKDALKQSGLADSDRPHPMIEWQGEIVWVRGIEIESRVARETGLIVQASPLG